MIMVMIISFSGRKGSGKTLLAQELVRRGFKKLSFADRLKEIISELFNFNLSDLSDPLKKEEKFLTSIKWTPECLEKLATMIGVSSLKFEPREFWSIRDILQFIGTDIIRNINENFHVQELEKKLSCNDNDNYVFDDVRFKNELELLRKYNAVPFFIIRPYYREYSNHQSEIDLQRFDFKHIILNDGSAHKLLRKTNMMLDSLLADSNKWQQDKDKWQQLLIKNDYDTQKCAEGLGCSRDKIVWWTTKLSINIDKNNYAYEHDCFSRIEKDSSYWAGLLSADGCIKFEPNKLIELVSKDEGLILGFQKFLKTNKPYSKRQSENDSLINYYTLTISDPYIFEDLKLWNLEAKKSTRNQIPDCLKNNDELLNYWICGLIDGDGSIYKINNGHSVAISILASGQIVDFIMNKYSNIQGRKYQEKDISNLFSLKFHGKAAVTFYKAIYRGAGMKRKWDIIIPFLSKVWHH